MRQSLPHTFILLVITLTFAYCNSNTREINEHSDDSVISPNTPPNQSNTLAIATPTSFYSNFNERTLPYELTIGNSDWIDFGKTNDKEMHRDSVVKYIFANNANRVIDRDGGYHQYYYGVTIKFNDTLMGLTYYRTAIDTFGYFLSLYNDKKQLLDEFLLAGTKGEYDTEAQKEARITERNEIETKEIILNKKGALPPCEGKIIKSYYNITPQGKIRFLRDSITTHITVLQDEKTHYRLYEKQ